MPHRNINFLRKFMLSCLLLLSIPFTAILITYHTAAKSIENEIRTSNENILYQFFQSVDFLLSDAAATAFSLSRSDYIQSYGLHSVKDVEFPSIDTYYVSQALNAAKTDCYDNIFVVFPKLDKIISLSNSLSTELFYQAYYEDNVSYAEFWDILDAPAKNFQPTLVSIGKTPASASLGVVCSFSSSNDLFVQPDYIIVIMLGEEYQERLFHSSGLHNEGILTVFDANQRILLSSQPLLDPDISTYSFSPEELFGNVLESRQYEIQSFSSTVLKAEYLSAVPKTVFWNRLNHLRSFSFLCMLVCAVFSLIVSWAMARINYSPITSILEMITHKTSKPCPPQTNEFDYISAALSETFQEISVLSSQREVSMDIRQNKFLLNALMGNAQIVTDQDEDDAFQSNNIHLLSDYFGLIYLGINLDNDSSLGSLREPENVRILYFILSNVFQELCESKNRGYVVSITEDRYACLINFSHGAVPEDCLSYMNKIALQFKDFLQHHFRFTYSCSISEIHSGLNGIHMCYKDADAAMSYHNLYGRETTILFSQIKNKRFDYTSANNTKIKNLLLHYIKDSSVSQTASDMISRTIELSGLGVQSSLESYRCFLFGSLITFRMLINELGAGNLEIETVLEHTLLHSSSFEESKAFLTQTLDRLRRFYQDSQSTWTICDQTAQYLTENFSNPNINNNMLGDLFQISPSYLSRLFKEQKGISLSDFLNQKRMMHVKFLLETTSLSMEDIAKQAGYLSSSTLIKIFKKNEGITPGAYRSMIRAEEH